MLKKRILITAGATWVKLDDVRILTNIFTGKIGLFLARELKAKGHLVTLLINPHCTGQVKGFEAYYYNYFDEFKRQVRKILNAKRYDVVIHAASISDYKIKNVYKGKIPSKKKSITLQLVPTEKIIKIIRRLAKKSLLIQFKLEYQRKGLMESAYKSLKENKSDYVVANAYRDLKKGYKSFLINKDKKITTLTSKKRLSNVINKVI